MKSRSANLGRGGPNPARGASMGNEECSPSGGTPKRGMVGKECGIKYRSNNPDRRVPVGNEVLPSQAEERRNGGMERGMK